MAERVLKITMENCFGVAHEQKNQIEIIKYKNGMHYSKYSWSDIDHTKHIMKKEMLASEVDKILLSLSNLKIPVNPKHIIGLDGGFTELEIGSYSGLSKFRWWSEPPSGWEKLDKIAQDIIKFATHENA